jgi:succinyl-CoA synthetase alpha subunit
VSVLLDRRTRICVQGVSGLGARTHLKSMLAFGTNVVACTAIGRAEAMVGAIPVFGSVGEAVDAVGPIDMTVAFVGRQSALGALLEAADSGVSTAVCMEEFVPVHDIVRAKRQLALCGTRLIGPNTNGIVSMGEACVGFFPLEFNRAGSVGVASRSGTLSYGAIIALQKLGLGQSTVIGVGGSQIRGVDFVDCLKLFRDDCDTEIVVLLGEIGGADEQEAANYVVAGYPKPVIALVVGKSAPAGVAMGHAGAIVGSDDSSWTAKTDALKQAGVLVADDLDSMAEAVREVISTAAGLGGRARGER